MKITSNTTLAEKLVRPELLALNPYQSARRIGGSAEIWLNANESPFSEGEEKYNRYPEFQPNKLVRNYALYAQVATNQVMTCRGADEAIELLIRTFCTPGQDSITICTPTYGMYAISAKSCNVAVNEVPLTRYWQLAKNLSKEVGDSKLLFICNPNNPTGSTISPQQIIPVLNDLREKCLVVIDEAYIEFSPELTMTSLIEKYPNLVILRTLSKAFALAGLRCGFMLANKNILHLVQKIIAPYPIPAPVVEIASMSLTIGGARKMRGNVAKINKLAFEFRDVATRLNKVSKVYATGANFVLVRFEDDSWFKKIAKAGILVRNQTQVEGLSNCLRFTIGCRQEMQRLTSALIKISKSMRYELS